MISILIPVYNYSIVELAEELINQGSKLEQPYEIIFLDDCSSNREISKINQSFCIANNVTYIISEINLGRAKARNYLARKAKYTWILFLDSDVFPVHEFFLSVYNSLINKRASVFCGDIVYRKNLIDKEHILRWKYGVKHEEVSLNKRIKEKYLHVKSANVFMRKSIFIQSEFPVLHHNYGFEDTLFGLILQDKGIDVELIENPVYHEGLEANHLFLSKSEEALKNLVEIIKGNTPLFKQIRIAYIYLKLKKFRVEGVVRFLFLISKGRIKLNLFSKNPNILLFQFYKLGYLCELFNKNQNLD